MAHHNTAILTHTGHVPNHIPLSPHQRTSHGSLLLQFSTPADGELLRIDGDNGHLTITITGGRLDGDCVCGTHWRHLDAEDAIGLDDGRPHTLIITADNHGMRLAIDGYDIFATTLGGWTKDLAATRILLDPQDTMHITTCTLYPQPLTPQAALAASPGPEPDIEFAAATLSPRDVEKLNHCRRGSIAVRMRARGRGQHGVILAADGAGGNLTLSLDPGGIHCTIHDTAGTTLGEVHAPGSYDDGHWRTIVLTAGRGALTLHIDGYQAGYAPGVAFFTDIAPLSTITAGMDTHGVRLFGEAHSAAIYTTALTDHQIKKLSGTEPLHTQALFDTGMNDAISYRIPALLTLKSGTVLAACDQRVSIANDAPGDINLVLRRSHDGGTTWDEPRTLIVYPGTGLDGASVTDPVLIQDPTTGRVFILIDHFPGGIGQPNSEAGTGHTPDGHLILHDTEGNTYHLNHDGEVHTPDGEPTDYTVDTDGNVAKAGHPVGNIHLAHSAGGEANLYTHRSSYLHMIYSDDDGATWSAPIDITTQVKKPWMRFLGTSPGNGIHLRSGRLIVPVYYNHEEGSTFSSAAIYSDDHGHTWTLGGSPNDGRELFGTRIDSRTLSDDRGSLYETTLVEDNDGNVHVYCRNQHPSGRVAHAISTDGGETWGEVTYLEQLTEIFSQPNAIRITLNEDQARAHGSDTALIFANASRMLPFRGCGVLRASFDNGKTWPHSKVFNPRHYVYQCMTQLPDGRIGCLWERETQGLFFTALPLEWITDTPNTQHHKPKTR